MEFQQPQSDVHTPETPGLKASLRARPTAAHRFDRLVSRPDIVELGGVSWVLAVGPGRFHPEVHHRPPSRTHELPISSFLLVTHSARQCSIWGNHGSFESRGGREVRRDIVQQLVVAEEDVSDPRAQLLTTGRVVCCQLPYLWLELGQQARPAPPALASGLVCFPVRRTQPAGRCLHANRRSVELALAKCCAVQCER